MRLLASVWLVFLLYTCSGAGQDPTPSIERIASAEPAASAAPSATPEGPVSFRWVSQAHAGQLASVLVQAQPRETCALFYVRPGAQTGSAQRLSPRQADAQGDVSWTWQIDGATAHGTAQLRVTCTSGSASTPLTVA